MYFIVTFVLIYFQYNLVLSQINKNNFGPYIPVWDWFKTCKGPKQTDCGLYQIVDATNMSNIHLHLEIDKECPVTSARVTVSSLQANNKTKKLFNYGLDKPCQHFVLGPILIGPFKLNNNCKFSKGNFDVRIDMVEKTTMLLGPSFFYGIYEFKFMALNKDNNVICIQSKTRIEKVDKS